jgi:hypothetical protein
VDLNLPGQKGLEDWWGKKGLMEEDWNVRSNWRKYNCQMGAGRCGNIVQPAK